MSSIRFYHNLQGDFACKGVLLSIVLLFLFSTGHSQKKLTDSLTHKKILLENRPGFVATDTNYIKVLYELGWSYIYQIPDSTKSISERVIQLSEQEGFEKGVASGKLGLGMYNNITGDFQEASKHLKEAEEKSRNTNAKKVLLRCINTKAMGQFMKGNYPETYLECKKGEDLAAKIGDLESQISFAMNLATCFAILRDYEQALPYYNKALNIADRSNRSSQKAEIQSNMGYLYLHTEDYANAKYYCKKAIPVLSREKKQAWESFAWTTLGEVAIREKDYRQALEYFSISDSLLTSIEDMQRKAENSQGIADVHYLKNDYRQSLEYALTAEKISKNINYHQGIVRSSELLYKLFIKKNNPKIALDYLSVAKHLSDSILESENRTKFLMLETQARFDREKKLTEFENEKKLATQKTISYIAIILLLALLVIALLVRKNAVNQKRANQSLKELNNTKDKLFSIIGHDLKTPIGTLQELLELYTSNEISEEEIAKLAPRLKQNVDYSSFTLNNLLFWAKTQMSGISPVEKKVSVKKTVNSVCNTYTSQIEAKNLNIESTIDPNLSLSIDPMHFEIILRNIISNAIKYSNNRGLITFSSRESDNGMAKISICDAGIGISKSVIEDILQNETINSSPGTMGEKGTGIGLQIVQDLVKINKGSLRIESESKKGTCILLFLEGV